VRPDAGKQRFLAVSLLYTENTNGECREPLLTVRQVAHILGLCTETVYRQCANGSLRHARVAWAIRIARSDLEAFIEAGSSGVAGADSLRLPPAPPQDEIEGVRAGTDQDRVDGERLASGSSRERGGPEED
jgi:excisionase family DNA binding protein